MATYFGYDLPESDKRRKHAKTLTRLGMSADHANLASIIATFTDHPGRSEYDRPIMRAVDGESLQKATADHPAGTSQTALMGWWMLIEPNTAAFGRMLTKKSYPYGAEAPLRAGTLPVMKQDPDGVFVLTWMDPAERASGLRTTIEHYLDHHDLADESNRHNALYGGLAPITAVPVRHVFRDGSPTVSAWMAADGTGRILAMRRWLAQATAGWLEDHSWTNPAGVWETSAAALRTFLAASSSQYGYEPVPLVHSLRLLHPRTSTYFEGELNHWNMLAHNPNRMRENEQSWTGHHDTDQWLNSLDLLRGYADPEELSDGQMSGQEVVRDEIMSWLFDFGLNTPRQAFLVSALIEQPAQHGALRVFRDILGPDEWLAQQLAQIVQVLSEEFGTESFCDLYGIYGDLSSGEAYGPLLERGNKWARVGAALALVHVSALGLLGHDQGDFVSSFGPQARLDQGMSHLLTSARSWPQVCQMAKAAARDVNRIPFVDGAGQVVAREYIGKREMAELMDWCSPA